MTISSLPLMVAADLGSPWPDDVADLTDRRRIFVRAVLGVDLPATLVDRVFEPAAAEPDQTASPSPSSPSTTMRSLGRSSSTDER